MVLRALVVALLALVPCGVTSAAWVALPPPASDAFVVDAAGLLLPDEVRQISATCSALLREQGVPLLVVTVESMERHFPVRVKIETFADLLFRQWKLEQPDRFGAAWAKGMLLVVAREDRAVRVQLGPAWTAAAAALCTDIVDLRILPAFRDGRFAGGVAEGVDGLNALALGLPVAPDVGLLTWARARAPWGLLSLGVFFAGVAFLIFHYLRRKPGGWDDTPPSATIGSPDHVVGAGRSGGGYSGGGYSGGGFSGGSGGGGGATGSW